MIDLLRALSRALPLLGEASLTAVYVAAVVAVLRLILKKRAPKQVLCLLWLVVFARLLIPVNLESPLSILPDQERIQAVQGLIQTAPAQGSGQGQNVIGAEKPASQENGGTDAPALFLPGGASANASQDEPPADFSRQTLLAGVWLAGAAALMLYALGSYLRLRLRLFDAIRAGDGAWEHPAVRSPFILGMIRPKIYLPAGLSGQPRKFILCHERAHLRRLDHIVKPVCWAALVLHWFNPAVWAAFLLMSRDMEAACDEAVIRRLGPRVKADYSETLLALATGRRLPAPCPLAFDEGDAKGRIQNVLRYRRPAVWIVVVSAIAAALAAVCLLTDPVSARDPDENPDPSPSQPQTPEDGALDPWMEEILAGRQNFTSADTGESVNTGVLNGAYPYDTPFGSITLSRYAVVDLDRDGLNELILSPSLDGDDTPERVSTLGFLILRRQGDSVSSYNLGYRAFGSLKADGTFWFSGSASDSGYARLRFADGSCTTEDVTYSRGIYDENSGGTRISYFVEGRSATNEEFQAAIEEWNARPDAVWYPYAENQMKDTSIRVPIPLGEYAQASVPDFLDAEQQLLYQQALTMYAHIFGANTEEVDNWPGYTGYNYDYQNPYNQDGASYVPATGLYANWADFEEAVLSVFTQNFWQTRNSGSDGIDTYINRGGILFYRPIARGSGGYNDNFPPAFRLVEKTDDTISFLMTGYYSDPRPFYGNASDEEIAAWLAAGWEYSIEFPMRMVRTENGWRFDEFHATHTDNGLQAYDSQHIPNPNAPAAPGASPEPGPSAAPEPAPSAAPMACAHGLDEISLEYVDNQLAARCGKDGFVYLIPGVTPSNYGGTTGSADGGGWLREDLDGDGRMELAVFTSAVTGSGLVVLDVENGAPVSSALDSRQITDEFNRNIAYHYSDDLSTLDLSYLGQSVQSPVDEGQQFEMKNRGGGFEPELWPTESRAAWTGGAFLYSFPVFIARGYGTGITARWSVRYTGGELQVVPDSFAFALSE